MNTKLKKRYKEEWVKLLGSYPWEIFGTLTFKEKVSEKKAHQVLIRFIRKINRKVFGPNHQRKSIPGVSCARVLERTKDNQLHWHILLDGLRGRIEPAGLLLLWNKSGGGFDSGKFEEAFKPYRDIGAAKYLSKYSHLSSFENVVGQPDIWRREAFKK